LLSSIARDSAMIWLPGTCTSAYVVVFFRESKKRSSLPLTIV